MTLKFYFLPRNGQQVFFRYLHAEQLFFFCPVACLLLLIIGFDLCSRSLRSLNYLYELIEVGSIGNRFDIVCCQQVSPI